MPRKKTKTTAKKKVVAKKTVRKTARKKVARKKSVKKRVIKKVTAKKKMAKKKAVAKKTVRKTAKKKVARKKPVKKRIVKKTLGKKIKINVTAPMAVADDDFFTPVLYTAADFNNFLFEIYLPKDFKFVSSNETEAQLPAEEYFEDESMGMSHHHKTIIMYIAITSVMVVIVGFWFIGIKSSLGQSFSDENTPKTNRELDEVNEALNDFQKEISVLGTQVDIQQQNIEVAAEAARQKLIEEKVKEEVSNQMIDKINNLNINQQ